MAILILAERLGTVEYERLAWNALYLTHGIPLFLLALSLLFFIPRSHLRRFGLSRLIALVMIFSADVLLEVAFSSRLAQMFVEMDVGAEISFVPYTPLPVIGMSMVWLMVGYGYACFFWVEKLQPGVDGSVPELPWPGIVTSALATLIGHCITTFMFSFHFMSS